MKEIAFFDFDGTITKKDTLLEFIKFSKGRTAFSFGFLLNLPYLVAFKLKIITNHKAKEKVLSYFFKDTPLASFQKDCEDFTSHILPGLIRPKALHEISKLRHAGVKIVIVTASPEYWIRKWADSIGAALISTQLEVIDGKLSGKILGNNCHGNEKVRLISGQYQLSDFTNIYAYGDSKGDLPMLQLANQSFYKPFR